MRSASGSESARCPVAWLPSFKSRNMFISGSVRTPFWMMSARSTAVATIARAGYRGSRCRPCPDRPCGGPPSTAASSRAGRRIWCTQPVSVRVDDIEVADAIDRVPAGSGIVAHRPGEGESRRAGRVARVRARPGRAACRRRPRARPARRRGSRAGSSPGSAGGRSRSGRRRVEVEGLVVGWSCVPVVRSSGRRPAGSGRRRAGVRSVEMDARSAGRRCRRESSRREPGPSARRSSRSRIRSDRWFRGRSD